MSPFTRLARFPVLFAGALLGLGCAGASNTSPSQAPVEALATLMPTGSMVETVAGTYDLTVDPTTLSATLLPTASRTVQGQGTSFDLDPAQFLKRDALRITAVEFDTSGELRLTFLHKHPFDAPVFANPTTAKNRADLGYTGRLLVLADLALPDVPGHTFFGDMVANTELVPDADGYVRPGNLLHVAGFATDCFPYVLLADEAKNNRIGVSNGGDMTGSYDAANGGWQQGNAGVTGDRWTGYDYVHGGQTVTNQFTLSASELGSGPVALQLAVLIKYTDPRGVPGFEHRFPTEPPNPIDFAYRLPYASLDASVITLTGGPITIDSAEDATVPVTLEIRDWDASATEAASSDLSAEADVSLIQQDASGVPAVELSIPALSAGLIPLTETGTHSGEPGDELVYEGTLTNTLGTAGPGDAMGLIRATDPEASDPNFETYHFGVDPVTILPDASRAVLPITYQALPVLVNASANAPTVESVDPIGDLGRPCDIVTFSAVATNSPTSWSWNFDGGATPNISTDASPEVILTVPGSHTGTVIATNAEGDSVPFPFSYSVTGPVTPGWQLHESGGTTERTVNQTDNTAIVVHNGGLAFCFVEGISATFDEKLMLAQTASSNPTDDSDWTISEIDAEGQDPMLVRYNGTLAAVWLDAELGGALRVGFSTGPVPVGPGDWTKYTLDVPVGWGASETGLSVIGGRLAVSYRGDRNLGVKFARAIDPQPVDASGWDIMTVDPSADAGYDTDLAEIDGVPMFTYRMISTGDVRLARATTAIPTTTGDWTTSLIEASATDENSNDNCQTSLVDLGGSRLGVMYADRNNFQLTFGYSSSYAPTGPSDWTIYDVVSLATIGGGGAEMIMVDGRPVCSYMNYGATFSQGHLRIGRAVSCFPTSADDWVTQQLDPVTGFGGSYVGRFSSIVEHNGALTIAYLNGNFHYGIARSDGTW